MVLNDNPNRLLIFFFYDRDGIVDNYISYMLNDIKENVKDIIVVCNGEITDAGRRVFAKFTSNIIERENKGFDVWAYKTALESLGWEKLDMYDEIVLMNFTMMGPIYPFRIMFDEMAKRDIDFWGITQFYKTDFDPWGGLPDGYIPDHIQSHFITVRKEMINSPVFHDYWDHMPMIKGYMDSVINHESKFTKYFEKEGFKWQVYVDAEDFRAYSYQPAVGMAKRMIDEKKCPIFKRRSFMQDYDVILNESCGQEAYELYKYLDEKTDYDVNLIWDNLLRVENQADLKKNLQWNYILSSETAVDKEIAKDKKIALVMHIHFLDLIDECARYAASMPDDADMYITTNTEEKKNKILESFGMLRHGKLDVRVVPNRGRDVGPFLVEFGPYLKQYDYICHVHDKKAGQSKPGSIGLSFAYKCFENVLKSKEYVSNVLYTFEKNERAGLLSPPPPNHSDYYFTLGLEWGSNYENTAMLAKELGMNVSIRKDKEPIAPLGSFFWARAKALEPLFEKKWRYEDFPEEPVADDGTILHAVERIYPFSAQSAGYYPGWILSESGAAIEITNLNHMLRQLNNIIFFKGNDAGGYIEVLNNLNKAYDYANPARKSGFDVAVPSKLYIDDGVHGFSEETAVVSRGTAGETEKVYNWSMEFEKHDWVMSLRFDPCENGYIYVKNLQFTVEDIGGRIFSYNLNNVNSNGARLDDKLVFIQEDPQIIATLKYKIRVKNVKISMEIGAVKEEIREIINWSNAYIKKKKWFRKWKKGKRREL